MSINKESTTCFAIPQYYESEISLYGCFVFTILSILQNANIILICCIESDLYIIISTIALIFISTIAIILTWILYKIEYTNTLVVFTGVIFILQIITTFINKICIIQYENINKIYVYVSYSYELLALFLIYILIENTINDTVVNIICMYIFIMTSMPAIQQHDQNKQDEQYFVMLSFLMLLPTLVVIAAPSVHLIFKRSISDNTSLKNTTNTNIYQV